MITKRGFEYIIQNIEPGEETEGIEISEEDIEGFEAGEYELQSQDLYNLKTDTIWWFRAICYKDGIKHYGNWMKNVPTINTESYTNLLALNSIPMVEAHGLLIDKGANDVTERGFRLIKEFKGNLWEANFYIGIAFGDFKTLVELQPRTILGGADGYTVVDYYWEGVFYRDSLEEGNFNLGSFMKVLGGGIIGEGLGYNLKCGDTYKLQAIAKNSLGTGWGELVNVNTLLKEYYGISDEELLGSGEIPGGGGEIPDEKLQYYYSRGMLDSESANPVLGRELITMVTPEGFYDENGNYIPSEGFYDKDGNYIPPGTELNIGEDIKELSTLEPEFFDPDMPLEEEKVGKNIYEKTVHLGNVPEEVTVTRIGIRMGRTEGCNELHYFEDGIWGAYDSVTFLVELEFNSTYYIMPYIVVDYGDYEEEILGMLNYTNPDNRDEYLEAFEPEITDDVDELEDELDEDYYDNRVGDVTYRTVVKEIKYEEMGAQGLIDYYGRRRSNTVSNHLIQTYEKACQIAGDYIDKFQRVKLKVAVDIDMPIPFQERDAIVLSEGRIPFKNTGQGSILFKADGEGEISERASILAKIRKVGISYTSGTEVIVPLELEV